MTASPDTTDLTTTATLIHRVQAGDEAAVASLAERCRAPLHRWARGRLPFYARDLSETEDLVQAALVQGLSAVATFEPRRQGAFLGYLRQILLNKLRDEIRRSRVRSGREPLDLDDPRHHTAALEAGAGRAGPRATLEELDLYEKALEALDRVQRDAVVLRFEFGMTFAEVAAELEMPTADAARMSVTRAIERLSVVMGEVLGPQG